MKKHRTTLPIFVCILFCTEARAATSYTLEHCLAHSEKDALNNCQIVDRY